MCSPMRRRCGVEAKVPVPILHPLPLAPVHCRVALEPIVGSTVEGADNTAIRRGAEGDGELSSRVASLESGSSRIIVGNVEC